MPQVVQICSDVDFQSRYYLILDKMELPFTGMGASVSVNGVFVWDLKPCYLYTFPESFTSFRIPRWKVCIKHAIRCFIFGVGGNCPGWPIPRYCSGLSARKAWRWLGLEMVMAMAWRFDINSSSNGAFDLLGYLARAGWLSSWLIIKV